MMKIRRDIFLEQTIRHQNTQISLHREKYLNANCYVATFSQGYRMAAIFLLVNLQKVKGVVYLVRVNTEQGNSLIDG